MTASELITRYDVADTAAGGTPRPFAKAVRAGDFVFVSGQVPALNGEVVHGGIVQQSEQVIANIVDVLKLADCTLADVVKVNIWLDDPRDFTSFNAVFEKHFINNPRAIGIDGRCKNRNGRYGLQTSLKKRFHIKEIRTP